MIEASTDAMIIRDVDMSGTSFNRFKRDFSLYDPVTHSYEYSVFTVIGNDDGEPTADIHVPMTIGAEAASGYFPGQQLQVNKAAVPKSDKIEYSMTHQPRDDTQREALNFLCAIKHDKEMPHRMLNLATGMGKTYVTIATLSSLMRKAMIIVDSIDLARQWKDEFLNHTDLSADDILILSGMDSVDKARKGKFKIFIAMHRTLGMMISQDQNAVNELMHDLRIGVRVFDECHQNFKNMCDINALSNVSYTIYLTATPARSNYREDYIYDRVFKYVPSYDGRKDQNEKYHTVVLTKFNSHPTGIQQYAVKTKYGFSLPKWAQFISTPACYPYYEKALLTLFDRFNLIGKKLKVAVMLPTIDLIDKTKESLEKKFPEIGIGRFVGEVKKKDRKTELDNQIILTDQKIFGKAMDVPDLDCIINFVQLSSKVNLEQMIGRLRNNPGHYHVFIDCTDAGYTTCLNQQKGRKTFYRKRAKKIIEFKDIL